MEPSQIDNTTIAAVCVFILLPVCGYLAVRYVGIKACLSRLEGKVDLLIQHFIPDYAKRLEDV